jgi:2-oxoglutarate dehydrogenase E2 component (dihydrolipoamide succinyltransferase)
MLIDIKIPSPGESITEVELAKWHVSDGDLVSKDQELAEVESDKATLPILAEQAGRIAIVISAGSTVAPGTVACTIDTSVKPVEAETPKTKVQKETAKEERKPDLKIEAISEIKVTPVAQAMMEEHNLSVEDIIKGLKHISSREVNLALTNTDRVQPEINHTDNIDRTEEIQKMTQLRKKLSKRLVAVKNETAMLTTFNEVNMQRIASIRKTYNERFLTKYGVKLGYMSFFTLAAAKALSEFRMVNSFIGDDEIITPNYVDVAIAVSTPKGLMVPVVRNADKKPLHLIEQEIAQLAEKARNNRLSIEEMTGGTFTITNGGVFGSLLSTPIINPPQSAILGMHNIVDRPIAENGQVVIRPMMYLALSYDHRIIDGKDSVSFLVRIKEYIENPEGLLLDI